MRGGGRTKRLSLPILFSDMFRLPLVTLVQMLLLLATLARLHQM